MTIDVGKSAKLVLTSCVIEAVDVPITITLKSYYSSGYTTTKTYDAVWSGTQYSSVTVTQYDEDN
jgi:hypothetical protein